MHTYRHIVGFIYLCPVSAWCTLLLISLDEHPDAHKVLQFNFFALPFTRAESFERCPEMKGQWPLFLFTDRSKHRTLWAPESSVSFDSQGEINEYSLEFSSTFYFALCFELLVERDLFMFFLREPDRPCCEAAEGINILISLNRLPVQSFEREIHSAEQN